MRITYIVRQIDSVGGRERVVISKANYFVEHYGYDVLIVTLFQQSRRVAFDLDGRVRVLHLDLLERNERGGRMAYYGYVKEALEQALVNQPADICISLWWGIEFRVLPFVRDGSRKILESHFSPYSRYSYGRRSFLGRLRAAVARRLDRRLVAHYDRFVVLTEEARSAWDGHNVTVIPNALSFVTDELSECTSRTVLSMGRLTREKGFDRLIRIWASLQAGFGQWTLRICGDGEERESLADLIAELGLSTVQLVPFSDAREEMLAASIFALTSRQEGFGLVLIEAMQCGLPVVTYDTKCGPREIVEHDVTGFVAREGDENGFAAHLRRLMHDRPLRLAMGAAAKVRSETMYSGDVVMKRWQELFEKEAV